MTGDERNQANAQEELTPEQEFQAYLDQDKDEEQQETAAPAAAPAAQTPASPKPEPEPADWIEAEVPETVRERVRREIQERDQRLTQIQNQHKAQLGQLQPTQRALEAARKELEQLKRPQQQPAKPAGMSNADWAKYAENFGEESKAIDGRLNPLETQLQTMAQRLAEIENEREVARSLDAVREIHPDFDEVESRPEFGTWLDDLCARDEIVADIVAKAGAGQKPTPRQVASIVTRFKEDAAVADAFAELEDLRTRVSGQQQQPAASPKAQAALARRDQQKRDPAVGFRAGQSAAQGRRNATGDSDEDAFAAYLAENPP